MFYTVYKTTNQVNGKFYIGVHATENPDDSYLGSGEALSHAIRKYGRASFKKEVLFVFDNADDMRAKEREIVDEDFVKRADTYNLMRGGDKGFGSMSQTKVRSISARGHEAQRELLNSDSDFRARKSVSAAKAWRAMREQGGLARGLERIREHWVGGTHSEETKLKMREAKVGHGVGSSNSQYGTAWVVREGCPPRKVPSAELESFVSSGWRRGRKI